MRLKDKAAFISGGARGLGAAMATLFAREGIRVNCIMPANIETMMIAHFLEEEESRQDLFNSIPLGHAGQPEDVAYGALYLASNESSFVTGSDLVIDGGVTAGR